MLAMKRKRVVLSSVFVAATIALAPLGWTQAFAATPSETHVSTSTTAKVPTSHQDYRRGFKDGFRSGFRQGSHSCNRHGHGHGNGDGKGQQAATVVHKDAQRDYRRGFKDGFKSGLRQAQRSCHR
ncbi:hypothetical protein ACWGDS_47105 [Streptomyces sp. NPDC055059]|jgi:hypothetical protein|uniref:hypothetical protein n=1 Tax=Streptomyces sp. NPDC127172 TaxID=3345382 RepID=UPI00362E233C